MRLAAVDKAVGPKKVFDFGERARVRIVAAFEVVFIFFSSRSLRRLVDKEGEEKTNLFSLSFICFFSRLLPRFLPLSLLVGTLHTLSEPQWPWQVAQPRSWSG